MGMYSEILSSYDRLGSGFTGYMQTKDLESAFDLYWIARDGTLYRILWPEREDSALVNADHSLRNPSRRGVVRPFRYTGCINFTGGRHGSTARNGFMCFDDGRLFTAASA
jgi:hypothetical protein